MESGDGVAGGACLFGLYSVVALLYAELPSDATAEGTVSYRGKAEVTFSDAISVMHRRLWLEGVFESHGQTEVFENLPRRLAGGDPGGLARPRPEPRTALGTVPRKRPLKGQKSS